MEGSPVDEYKPEVPPSSPPPSSPPPSSSPVPQELYDSGSDMEPMEADFVADFDDVKPDEVDTKEDVFVDLSTDEKNQWTRPFTPEFEPSSPVEEPYYTKDEPPAYAKSFQVMGETQPSSPSKKNKFKFPNKFSINMISLASPTRNIRVALMACLVLSTLFVFYLFVRRRATPEGVVQLTFDHNYPGDGIVNKIWDMSNPEVAAAAKAQQEYEAEKATMTEPTIEEAPMDQGFSQWGNDQQQQQQQQQLQGGWGQAPEQAAQQPSAFNFQGAQFGASWGQDQQQQQQQQQQPQQQGLPGMAQFGQQPQQPQQPGMGAAGGMFGQGQQQKPMGAAGGMGQFGAQGAFGAGAQAPQQQQQQQQQQQFGGYQSGLAAQGVRPGAGAADAAHLSPADRAAAAVGGFAGAAAGGRGSGIAGFGAARPGQGAGGFGGAGAQGPPAGGFGAAAAAPAGGQGYQRPVGGFGAQAAGGFGAQGAQPAGGAGQGYQAQMAGRGPYAQAGQQVGHIMPGQSHNMPAEAPVQNFAF